MNKNSYALSRVSPVLQELDNDSNELGNTPSIRVVIHPEHLVVLTEAGSGGAEKFRMLAIRLRNFQERRQLKKLLVTSSVKGEGKSVISANLALALGQRQRTLLIDADLHQSGLRQVLGSQDEAGLADWWRQEVPIFSFLRRLEGFSLWYLPAGQVCESPLEILQSERFSEMLNHIARYFEWVVIDSPPLAPVADSGLLANHADGTLLIVRRGVTPKPLLQEALKTENLKLLGIVPNEWEDADRQYYRHYYKNTRRTSEISA